MFSVVFCRLSTYLVTDSIVVCFPEGSTRQCAQIWSDNLQLPCTQARWRFHETRQPPTCFCTSSKFHTNATIETFQAGHLGRHLAFSWGGAGNASLMCSFILYIHYVVQPLVNSRQLTAICIQCIDIVNTTIGCIMRKMIRRTLRTIFVCPRPKPSSPDSVFFPLSRDEKVNLVGSGSKPSI